MKHRFTLLFALLCASMMTWAAEPITGSSTENMAGQGNPFTNGYDYSFSSEGTNVTISFTEKENYVGLEAYLWDYTTGGMVETKMTVSGSTATITLTEQTPGATIRFACKFAYSGGMSVTKEFTYTIPGGEGGGEGTEPEPGTYTANGHTIHLDAYYIANGESKDYTLVITSDEAMEGLGGSFWYVNGVSTDLRNDMTISDDKKTIICKATSTTNPTIHTPLYMLMPGEIVFSDITLDWVDRTPIASEYCNYQGPETLGGGKYITLTWETDADGNVVITMGNGTGASSCSFRNGGFEGGIEAFVVSTDDFVTTTPASNYFTSVGVYSGNTYTLTKIADVPAGAKIKHIGGGSALAWTVDDASPYTRPEFIYTYGGICNQLDAPTNVVVSADSVITFNAVDGATRYTAYVYLGDIEKYKQEVVSGDVLHFWPYVDSDYIVNLIASGEGKTDSEPSADFIWTLAAREVVLGASEYCEEIMSSGNTEAAFTWETTDEGAIIVTITESLGGAADAAHFRGNGMAIGNFKIGASRSNASDYFNHACDGGNQVILTLKDPAIAPVEGEKIYFDNTVEYTTSKDGNAWPTLKFEYTYGTVCVTKTVSASVNDEAMGTATVKQGGAEVTEVETGSEVTFSAVANDGYVFVEWSNGEKNATFTTTVDAALNLTATFRKLGTTYCNTEMTKEKNGENYTIYVTYKKTSNENEYKLVVRSTKELSDFGNAFIKYNGNNQFNLNDLPTLTDGGKTLSYTFTSTTEPGMNTPLYVVFAEGGEVPYDQLTDVEFAITCEDEVEVESIALDPSEATIEIGESKTLIPIFTPAYAVGQTLTWTSNDESIVSVSSDGVIVGNAEGEAVITATSANEKTATCNITVEPISEKTWWGLATITEWDNMPVMYSITRNIDRTLTYTVYFGGDASGKVMQINNGGWNELTGYTDSERKASFTTTTTYESGTQIKQDHFFYFGGPRIELANEYVVGASNEKPSTAVESVVISHSTASLMKDETIQLVASVVPAYADDKTLIWSSEDNNIATVDNNGLVTANAIGTTTITATSANGKTATCNVTVEALTEKTCWGVGNNFEYKETEVSYHYAFTRNADKTLTITAEFSHDITGIGNLNIVWNDIYHLMAYNATTKTATYTTVAGDTYETDAILPDAFFYFEGRRTDVTYIVGSVCDKPIVDVTGVEISNETKKLLTGETFTITANVIPANADNKNIIWSNSNPSVASIDEASGLVTALTTGTTIITATSQFDANLYATCEVTVVGALEPATWYGTAVFKVNGNPVGVNYSITRTSERKLTYRTVLSETVTSMSMQLNDGEYRLMTQDATGRIAEWTSTNTYLDGATHSMFFYPAFDGGAGRWDVNYTVGSSNEKPNTLVAFGDQADNTAKIAEYANEVVDAYINRTFPNTDEWYTLCLPFDMDEAQLAETFGAGYTLATLGSSDDRGSLIHLNFDYVNTLEAGKPYLLRPGVSTTIVPMIEAVTIKNADPSAAPQKAESTHMLFQGTFAPTTLEGDNKRFVGPNNYLYSPAVDGTTMGAFRCYFTIPVESQALVGSKAARIVFGPQVATGTENVQSDQVQSTKVMIDGTLYIIRGERTYNAQGQLVK